jgi:large subunit ribosomal protein L24
MAKKYKPDQKVKLHLRKGDQVRLLAGKDKGKEGKILRVVPAKGRIVVEGLNIAKKATRPNPKSQSQGGVVTMPAPLHASNAKLVCPRCNKPTRVTRAATKEGRRSRKCKKCGELIDA